MIVAIEKSLSYEYMLRRLYHDSKVKRTSIAKMPSARTVHINVLEPVVEVASAFNHGYFWLLGEPTKLPGRC